VAATSSQLQREIRQTKPFPSSREEAILSVLRTADLIRGAISSALEPAGITMQQYNVLRILRGAGPKGLPTLAIGERMIESAPGVTRLLDRMEKREWVTRERCQVDRRVVHAKLLPAGERVLKQLDGPLRCSTLAMLPGISDEDVQHLIELLARARNAISGTQPRIPELTPGKR